MRKIQKYIHPKDICSQSKESDGYRVIQGKTHLLVCQSALLSVHSSFYSGFLSFVVCILLT